MSLALISVIVLTAMVQKKRWCITIVGNGDSGDGSATTSGGDLPDITNGNAGDGSQYSGLLMVMVTRSFSSVGVSDTQLWCHSRDLSLC